MNKLYASILSFDSWLFTMLFERGFSLFEVIFYAAVIYPMALNQNTVEEYAFTAVLIFLAVIVSNIGRDVAVLFKRCSEHYKITCRVKDSIGE